MVVFLVIAIVAICAAVAFYQRASNARDAIATDQIAFEKNIAAVFRDNGWTLTEQSPPEQGIKFGAKSYPEITDKLKQAAEYEKQAKPLLGWDSLAGMQSALDDSPAQKEAAAKNQSKLTSMKALLSFYETSTAQQAASIADLRTQAMSEWHRAQNSGTWVFFGAPRKPFAGLMAFIELSFGSPP